MLNSELNSEAQDEEILQEYHEKVYLEILKNFQEN